MDTTLDTVINTLHSSWDELVAKGYMELEELKESLSEQVNGQADMSAEELTDELLSLMDWQTPLTDEQLDEWESIVVSAAYKWFDKNQRIEMEEKHASFA